ncbi:MAG TPA: hypothetical protein VGM16_12925 [Gammaproteobacteria bacterium]
MRHLALLSLLLAGAAASAAEVTVAQLLSAGKVVEHDSVIVATDKPHEADMCRGFSLTENQVKSFFRKAAVMDAEAVKKAYQWSPCEVQGHLQYQDQKFLYTVNAAGTGQIEVAPGKFVDFGCNSCQDLFDYGYLLPPAPTRAPAARS